MSTEKLLRDYHMQLSMDGERVRRALDAIADRRFQAACVAMQGLITLKLEVDDYRAVNVASDAVKHADALIAELDKSHD